MAIRPLSKQLQKKAEEELNEVPGRIEADLNHIKNWVAKQPHLNVRIDDQWLLSFLRGCKFSLQKAKDKLDFFYSARSFVPEIFSSRDPLSPDLQEILKTGCIFPLPKARGTLAPTILHLNTSVCNPDTIPLLNVMKLFSMVIDILMLEDDDCIVSGICYWVDYKDMPLKYLTQYTPSLIKKVVVTMQDSYPLRIKGVYSTNIPSIFESTFNLIKTMMNPKMQERMHAYSESNFHKIYSHIPKDIQPTEFGGNGGSIKAHANYWKNKIESYREWFIEDEIYRSDERKRVDVHKMAADMFGMEGAFRKLDID